jgi:hypothetical protein
MGHQFDELAKSLAGSVSRREALVRLGGGMAGMLLTTLGLGSRGWGAALNSQCEDFCRSHCGVRPGGGNAFGECVSSCEACVNSANALPCGCPGSFGSSGPDVVCTNCCLPLVSACTTNSQCCSGICCDRQCNGNC